MQGALVVAVVLAMQYASPGSTCVWSNISRENAAQLVSEFFNYADTVVHGRVLSRRVDEFGIDIAQVAVVRSFKGGAASPVQLRGHPGHCGYRFADGEERIYFIKDGILGLAGAKQVSPWLLAALNGLAGAK